jgi:membrane protein DedA with SNARE-associated domain
MVPIVRSFISVPAGVVRMPLGQFLLYTAGGSLIWNSVLIGLGVAAGDFVRDNLKYLDYAVVAAVVLGVGYLVYKRVMDMRRHRRDRAAPGAPAPTAPHAAADPDPAG